MQKIVETNAKLESYREHLKNHPLYQKITTVEALRVFTEIHVYAVWDFMSLLKALQINLTCTQVPWFATEMPNTRYLINEIVLAEESDESLDGRRLSHFELYLESMQSIGADVSSINDFLAQLKRGVAVFEAIDASDMDARVKEFLRFTFEIIATGEDHKIASAFTFGREDLIPEMFTSILRHIQAAFPDVDLKELIYYFQRHIDLDGDEHGPLAMQMIAELAQDDEIKWREMQEVAQQALEKRSLLWDAVADRLSTMA